MPSLPTAPPADGDAKLRLFNLITFPPALLLLIIHGACANRPLPALGTIPLFASAILSAIILYRDKVVVVGSPIQFLNPSNILIADISIAVIETFLLFITWSTLADHFHKPLIVLGTYGSVFMMVNVAIHFYFIIKRFHIVVRIGPPCECEHCVAVRRQYHPFGQSEHTPLTAEYDEQIDGHVDIEAPPSLTD
ncbi:hypothetical protein GQ53DRAFT_819729 [Thozetella sp. PMI_491]|nr:hypothetical protein GQ53DRAFT_819729 [Thozetella sp. PMI_491]